MYLYLYLCPFIKIRCPYFGVRIGDGVLWCGVCGGVCGVRVVCVCVVKYNHILVHDGNPGNPEVPRTGKMLLVSVRTFQ